MTITRPKIVQKQFDGFIAAAPDGGNELNPAPNLKAKRGKQRSQVSVVLPDEVLAKVDAVAKQRYMSRSALITLALVRCLAEYDS